MPQLIPFVHNNHTIPLPQQVSTSESHLSTLTQHATPFLAQKSWCDRFWQHTINVAEQSDEDFKFQMLPLARIKKVMKSDPQVKMISSEVMILFEKACQIFIQETTARSHLISLESGRRTLTRQDVSNALSKSDVFDFLIDLLPQRPTLLDDNNDRNPSKSNLEGNDNDKGSNDNDDESRFDNDKKRNRIDMLQDNVHESQQQQYQDDAFNHNQLEHFESSSKSSHVRSQKKKKR
ncbi:CCAAT- binding transcription factor component [Microbotryomycetes sp. JL221]|nr:CCAAT- binding transcription factor component [Microbotryomycetes sp. JL221]